MTLSATEVMERAADLLHELHREQRGPKGAKSWRTVIQKTAEQADPRAVQRCPADCLPYLKTCQQAEASTATHQKALRTMAAEMLSLRRGARAILAHMAAQQYPACYRVLLAEWKELAGE